MTKKSKTFSGDSLIEVLLGITIFSAVSVGGIAIMNSGLNQAQRSLEITMTRNEIDAQAEALRFIHNNYVAERELAEDKWQFTDLWNKIVEVSMDPSDIMSVDTLNINDAGSCADAYAEQFNGQLKRTPFIINTRFVQPRGILTDANAKDKYRKKVVPEIIITDIKDGGVYSAYDTGNTKFREASTYPRLTFGFLHIDDTPIDDSDTFWTLNQSAQNSDTLSENLALSATSNKLYYRKLTAAEGIWILGVKGDNDNRAHNNNDNPEFYDFYIRSCWNSSGMKTHSTITTTVRLYNPGVID